LSDLRRRREVRCRSEAQQRLQLLRSSNNDDVDPA